MIVGPLSGRTHIYFMCLSLSKLCISIYFIKWRGS